MNAALDPAVSRYPLRKDLDQRVVWNMLSTNFPRAFPGNRNLYAYTKGMFRSLLSSLTLRQIAQEAKDNPDELHAAPHHSPVGRLDEVRAAREPILRWKAKA